MLIGKFKPYRGITGTIEFSNAEFHGELLDVEESVVTSYTADSLEDLEKEFHIAVDEYFYCSRLIEKNRLEAEDDDEDTNNVPTEHVWFILYEDGNTTEVHTKTIDEALHSSLNTENIVLVTRVSR